MDYFFKGLQADPRITISCTSHYSSLNLGGLTKRKKQRKSELGGDVLGAAGKKVA